MVLQYKQKHCRFHTLENTIKMNKLSNKTEYKANTQKKSPLYTLMISN